MSKTQITAQITLTETNLTPKTFTANKHRNKEKLKDKMYEMNACV
jgi:hypothetical protein